MKLIGIIGNGKIGRSLLQVFGDVENFNVVIADTYNDSETVMVDATDKSINKFNKAKTQLLVVVLT